MCGPTGIVVAVADRALRQSIEFLLQVEGYRVFAFAGAEAALKRLDSTGPRVLVIDSELAMAPDVTHVLQTMSDRNHDGGVLLQPASILFLASTDAIGPAFASTVLRKPVLGQSLLEAVSLALGEEASCPLVRINT